MEKYQQIRDLIVSSEGDFDKFYNKGNKAAGTRVRKAMQDLKELAQAIRIDVQGQKNGWSDPLFGGELNTLNQMTDSSNCA